MSTRGQETPAATAARRDHPQPATASSASSSPQCRGRAGANWAGLQLRCGAGRGAHVRAERLEAGHQLRRPRRVRGRRRDRAPPRRAPPAVGPAVLALSGLGPVHSVVTFLGAGIGLIVLSRRMAHDPRWGGLAGYALATGIAILVVIPIYSALALPRGAPLHPWRGLLNWSALALWLACTVVLAFGMLRVARSAAGS